jgi:hypothetical protein
MLAYKKIGGRRKRGEGGGRGEEEGGRGRDTPISDTLAGL